MAGRLAPTIRTIVVKTLIAFRIICGLGETLRLVVARRILRVIHGRDARATPHLTTRARSCRRKICLLSLSERRTVPSSGFLEQVLVFLSKKVTVP